MISRFIVSSFALHFWLLCYCFSAAPAAADEPYTPNNLLTQPASPPPAVPQNPVKHSTVSCLNGMMVLFSHTTFVFCDITFQICYITDFFRCDPQTTRSATPSCCNHHSVKTDCSVPFTDRSAPFYDYSVPFPIALAIAFGCSVSVTLARFGLLNKLFYILIHINLTTG